MFRVCLLSDSHNWVRVCTFCLIPCHLYGFYVIIFLSFFLSSCCCCCCSVFTFLLCDLTTSFYISSRWSSIRSGFFFCNIHCAILCCCISTCTCSVRSLCTHKETRELNIFTAVFCSVRFSFVVVWWFEIFDVLLWFFLYFNFSAIHIFEFDTEIQFFLFSRENFSIFYFIFRFGT